MGDPANLAYIAGLALGILIILSVIAIFVRDRKVGAGGLGLGALGFALLALPLLKEADFGGNKFQFQDSRHQTDLIKAANPPDQPKPNNNANTTPSSAVRQVAIINSSSTDDDQIKSFISALQKQITDDVSPYWRVQANLSFYSSKDKIPAGTWSLNVLNTTDDVGMMGYHLFEATSNVPIAKIFAEDAKKYNTPLSFLASHELINMLINPNLTRFIEDNNQHYAVEPASPCGSLQQSYVKNGVTLSDFVYPSWYKMNTDTHYDYAGKAIKPLTPCQGGYVLILDPTTNTWKTVTGN
jgi:hypothetical protein